MISSFYLDDQLLCLEITKDFSQIIFSCNKNIGIQILNTSKNQIEFKSNAYTRINHLTISEDNTYFASSDRESKIKIWNLNSRQVEHILTNITREIIMIRFFKNNDFLIDVERDNSLNIWDIRENALYKKIQFPKVIGILELTSNFSHIFIGGTDFDVYCWDFITEPIKIRYVESSTIQILISKNDDYAFLAKRSCVILMWDIRKKLHHRTIVYDSIQTCMSLSSDQKFLYSISRVINYFKISSESPYPEKYFQGHTSKVINVEIRNDKKYIATIAADAIRIWTLIQRKQVDHIMPFQRIPKSIKFYKNSKILVFQNLSEHNYSVFKFR